MRADYSTDPTLWPAVRRLLCEVFPGFDENEAAARDHGLRWDRCSTPFVERDGDEVLSHVGVLALPLVVEGRRVVSGGVHAVATRLRRRGEGLAARLLAEAVAWAEGRHAALVLSASRPDLYSRAGFSVVPETRFFARTPCAGRGRHPARFFDWSDAAERARLDALLAEREPVSLRLCAAGDRDVFLFNSARCRLRWVDAWGGLLWLAGTPEHITVLDVIARRMPSWPEIVGALPAGDGRVELAFPPDRVGGDFVLEPQSAEEILMARGAFPASAPPRILSPASRC